MKVVSVFREKTFGKTTEIDISCVYSNVWKPDHHSRKLTHNHKDKVLHLRNLHLKTIFDRLDYTRTVRLDKFDLITMVNQLLQEMPNMDYQRISFSDSQRKPLAELEYQTTRNENRILRLPNERHSTLQLEEARHRYKEVDPITTMTLETNVEEGIYNKTVT